MKILFCEKAFDVAVEALSSLLPGHEILVCRREEIEESVKGVDVAIPLMSKIERRAIEKGSFRLIQQFGVGLEGVDIEAATERGVFVANVPSQNAASAAEHALFLALALAKRYPQAQKSITTGILGRPSGLSLVGKTFGIVGLGNIGRQVVMRLKPFEVKIMALKARPSLLLREELGLDFLGGPGDLDLLLASSDFVILCLPLTEKTRGLIGKEQLRKMKKGSFLINIARGSIVDKEALIWALEEEQLEGAGLDVFWQEPIDPKDELFQYNVVATPHVAGATVDAYLLMAHKVAENILRVERGEAPLHCVNLEALRR